MTSKKVSMSTEQREIFEAIVDSEDPATAFDLEKEIGYPRPVVYRLLSVMLKKDFIREVKTKGGIKGYIPSSDITGEMLFYY